MEEAFGQVLRTLRSSRKCTLSELAKCLGVSITYLSDVERGRRAPFDNDRIFLLADYLEASADELVEAAAESRGAFELATSGVGPKAKEVGAALMRRWEDLSDDELNSILRIVERKVCSDE